jgi:hypothetical protein
MIQNCCDTYCFCKSGCVFNPEIAVNKFFAIVEMLDKNLNLITESVIAKSCNTSRCPLKI